MRFLEIKICRSNKWLDTHVKIYLIRMCIICIVLEPSHLYHADVQHVISSEFNKRWRQPKGQSRIDNQEILATLGTQNTGRSPRQKKKQKKTQHRNLEVRNKDPTKHWGWSAYEWQVVLASYKTPSLLLK